MDLPLFSGPVRLLRQRRGTWSRAVTAVVIFLGYLALALAGLVAVTMGAPFVRAADDLTVSGTPVVLDVSVRHAEAWVDVDGCTREVRADASSSGACEVGWPGPSGPLPAAAPAALALTPVAGPPVDAAGTGGTPSVTPPPTDVHLGPPPAHPFRPGWGWVVLGLICFAVVLGLAWPDHRDGG